MEATKKIILIRYELILRQDGSLLSVVDHVPPDRFLEEANKASPEWQDGVVITNAIRYLIGQLKALDEDFEKYIESV